METISAVNETNVTSINDAPFEKHFDSFITEKLFLDEELITPEVTNFADTCIKMVKLYAKKNHDYGDSFNQGMKAIGMAYGQGRLFDKFNRFMNLCKTTAKVKDETIIDTLQDLACYSIMLSNFLQTPNKIK